MPRILEIITVPFFSPRGTGFSSLERTRALSKLGCRVEILAYSIGDRVDIPNVSVYRIPRIPGFHSIKMGPSLKKLVLDVFLLLKTIRWLLFKGSFDVVWVHEESAYWMPLLKCLYRGPVVYDMHSSLVEQLDNFGNWGVQWLKLLFQKLEHKALERADSIIVICQALECLAHGRKKGGIIRLIENLPVGWDLPEPTFEQVAELRRKYQVNNCKVLLYTGTFGKNQGLDLLLGAMPSVVREYPNVKLMLVGGTGADMRNIRDFRAEQGLEDYVVLEGQVSYADMPMFMALGDVLLSPRVSGKNTPLKLYSYLNSGKPIVATDMLTHRQVLDEETAVLTAVNADALAQGILSVLRDEKLAARIGLAGRHLAESKYGYSRYMNQLAEVLQLTLASNGTL